MVQTIARAWEAVNMTSMDELPAGQELVWKVTHDHTCMHGSENSALQ